MRSHLPCYGQLKSVCTMSDVPTHTDVSRPAWRMTGACCTNGRRLSEQATLVPLLFSTSKTTARTMVLATIISAWNSRPMPKQYSS